MTPVGVRGSVRLQLGFNTRSIPSQMGCVLNTRILQLPQFFNYCRWADVQHPCGIANATRIHRHIHNLLLDAR